VLVLQHFFSPEMSGQQRTVSVGEVGPRDLRNIALLQPALSQIPPRVCPVAVIRPPLSSASSVADSV